MKGPELSFCHSGPEGTRNPGLTPRHKGFWVYILCSACNGTLYIGVTDDLAFRMAQHKAGSGSEFCAKYGVKTLVYYEHHQYAEQAFKRETQLKGWRRAWKIALIEESNPKWKELPFDEA